MTDASAGSNNAPPLKKFVLAVSALSYATSLFLPGILTQTQALHGIYILSLGWMGLLIFEFTWFANPCYFLSIWFMIRERSLAARVSSIVAIAFALTSYFAAEWWFHEGFGTKIVGLGVGFYIWLASLLLLLVATTIRGRLI